VSYTPPRRTIFTTLVGVAAILLGGAASVFSLFALLLAIGKPYASSSDPLGIFLIFILPPGTLLAGIGLLLRQRWARWWMILLMVGLVALGAKGWLSPDPAYAPIPGPAAEAMNRVTLVGAALCVGMGVLVLSGLFSARVRREFGVIGEAAPSVLPEQPKRPPTQAGDWRVGHHGRDMMYYEERHAGGWRRIDIDGEMLTGRAHHVIYFAGAEMWHHYPEWARHRRDEIIARIKSRFCEPDYEYSDGGTASARPHGADQSRLRTDDGTIVPMLLFLVLVAVGSFWLAARGIGNDEVRLPVKHQSSGRMISRDEKPVLFWTSIGLVSAVGLGSVGMAAWLVLCRVRSRR
jgi:hypothetical protein